MCKNENKSTQNNDVHILLACMPRSGSTFLSTIISFLPDFVRADLVPSYERRKQELSQPEIERYLGKNFVAQHHVRLSDQTHNFIIRYALFPIILVRDIFDIVVSLNDYFSLESTITPVAYFTEEILGWSEEKRLEAIVDLAVPWYFNFFASWFHYGNRLFITYEELIDNPLVCVKKVLEFAYVAEKFSDNELSVVSEKAGIRTDQKKCRNPETWVFVTTGT